MAELVPGVWASVGFASQTGPREHNEDFAGAVFGWELPQSRRDVVAAMADGIGGSKGGRVAAETAVRGFLDGMCDLPETMEVRRAGAKVLRRAERLDLFPRRRDDKLAGMGCTFTALVLRGRDRRMCCMSATRRAYRLGGDRLGCLTSDHVPQGRRAAVERPDPRARRRNGGAARLCRPAGGAARPVPVVQRRRARLPDGRRRSPRSCASAPRREDSARALVAAALNSGSSRQLHRAGDRRFLICLLRDTADVGAAIAQLPLIPVPAERRDRRRLRAQGAGV